MNWNRYKREGADGRALCELDIRKFWQSRMTVNGKVPPLPQIVDISEMARKLGEGA